ncbi:MAG: hypothetical protein AB7O38_16515, partial [Pirellulaceae bacterium]
KSHVPIPPPAGVRSLMAARRKYKLEAMVKDATVAQALSRALDGDGKLSYDEMLAIIYSACDGNSIREQEVKDITAILDNAKSIGNDPKISELKARFKSNPNSFLKYRDFSSPQITEIVDDVQRASRLAQKCMNALVASPVNKPSLITLLRHTFNVSIQDRSEIADIQSRFRRCWKELNDASFHYDKEGKMLEPHHFAAAPYEGRMSRLVYISRQYFGRDKLFRCGALIHEMIHHFNGYRSDAHPGGVKTNGRLPLNISFREAIANPYCYQWFAIYLEQPNYSPTIHIETEAVIRAR